MSVDDESVVDAIGIDGSGTVVLTISDHLPWDKEHLYLLQQKINSYLAFIESGEIYESYPESKEREIKICLECKFEPTAVASTFLGQCSSIIGKAGFQFGHEVHT